MRNLFLYWKLQYHFFWTLVIPFYEPEYNHHLREYNRISRELGLL